MKNILIVTGEKSGEILGRSLILEIKKQTTHSFHFSGMAGSILSPYLDERIIDSSDFGVVGFIEALSKYRILKAAQKKLFKVIKSNKFDVVLLIDFIGFNLSIGRFAKQLSIPVVLYVGPQIWAWKRDRIKQLKKCIDYVGLILPFEEKLYEQESFYAEYVGNPLMEILPLNKKKDEVRQQFTYLEKEDLVITLLPGSRYTEIKNHFVIICNAIELLHKKYPESKFILPFAKKSDLEYMNTVSQFGCFSGIFSSL